MSDFFPRCEGAGWRPELALAIDRRPSIGFVEVIAEDFWDDGVPPAVRQLQRRGVEVVPHAITLSLGGAEPPDPARIDQLARFAEQAKARLVSEHICFVRAAGVESGHLLPTPLTRQALDVMIDNVRRVTKVLSVPLALENIATLFTWPGGEMSEPAFLRTLLDETGTYLLLDIENVYANARNHGFDALAYVEALPLDRVAYAHVAGGYERNGIWYDTHTHPVPDGVLTLVEEVAARTHVPGVMLERDDHFPTEREWNAEMDAIADAVRRGTRRREARHACA